MQNTTFALTSLSPLDGRYHSQLQSLAEYFSEQALMQYRLKIEVEYLLFLSDQQLIPQLEDEQKVLLKNLVTEFSTEDALEIKTIEQETKHDVKAVEYYVRKFSQKHHIPFSQWIHLGLTSEDTNSLALSLIIKDARDKVLLPTLRKLLRQLAQLSEQYREVPILARTHGQPATPTTFGKELLVFAMRLLNELRELEQLTVTGKLNGAVGTFAAQELAFPDHNWPRLSQIFIASLGLQPNNFTTQILPAETYTTLFSSMLRINTLLLDLNQDLWRYISDGYLTQSVAKHQVGSSTMPHKINPIDFENSEGNLGLANSLLTFFIQKLPISRLQRDLSDSTVKRNIGTAFGYSLLAYSSLLKGLSKISVDATQTAAVLSEHWEVVTEAIQVVLRAHGDDEGYEKLRVFSQGKKLGESDIKQFIESLTLPEAVTAKLLALSPHSYIGSAPQLVTQGLATIHSYLEGER